MASCVFVAQNSSAAGLYVKPWQRSTPTHALAWNPIANFTFISSKGKKINERTPRSSFSFYGDAIRVPCDAKNQRNSVVVYANAVPGAPVPSGPPSSSNSKGWIFGFLMSFILPMFTNKWGPLMVIKNRIMSTVQTVENLVETVEKAAEAVDKIAEDIADDLPQGKLRDLVEMVENVAEKTAKTADCLDNVIDQVQEAEDHMGDVVECIVKDGQITNSPKAAAT